MSDSTKKQIFKKNFGDIQFEKNLCFHIETCGVSVLRYETTVVSFSSWNDDFSSSVSPVSQKGTTPVYVRSSPLDGCYSVSTVTPGQS